MLMRLLLLIAALGASCAARSSLGAQIVRIEDGPPPDGWAPEASARHCTPAGERLVLTNGRVIIVLECPDGTFVGADAATGKVIH
jgi:hypothetical protein